MKKNIKSETKSFILKERIGITALAMVLVLLFFFLFTTVTFLAQKNDIKTESYRQLEETISTRVEMAIYNPFELNREVNDDIAEDPKPSPIIPPEGNRNTTSFIVLSSKTVDRWIIGDSEDYQALYEIVSGYQPNENGCFKGRYGDFYFGIYTAEYYNSNLKKADSKGMLKQGMTIYAAIDISVQIKATFAVFENLLITLSIAYFFLIFIVFYITKLILKPSQEAIQKQNEFIANASHELKTPLAIINANAAVLKEKSPEQAQYLENINQQCENMNETIIDMIALSKLEYMEEELKEVNLSDLLFNLCLSFDAVAFEREIDYQYNIEPNLILSKADQKNLVRLFNLLIENAMKYVENEKKVAIRLKKEKGGYHFTIYNTGCQVDDENREKIFNRFYQGRSGSDNERRGSGLGLAIVRQIATKYNYDLSVDSKKGVFIRFDIVFR